MIGHCPGAAAKFDNKIVLKVDAGSHSPGKCCGRWQNGTNSPRVLEKVTKEREATQWLNPCSIVPKGCIFK
jgi:hypothetical protein